MYIFIRSSCSQRRQRRPSALLPDDNRTTESLLECVVREGSFTVANRSVRYVQHSQINKTVGIPVIFLLLATPALLDRLFQNLMTTIYSQTYINVLGGTSQLFIPCLRNTFEYYLWSRLFYNCIE